MRGAVDVQSGASGVCLYVEELEPQRRGQILEQGKPLPQRHSLQDKAVLVDEPESAERLGERGAASGEHILSWLAFERRDLLSQVAACDPRLRPLGTLERPGRHDFGDLVHVARPLDVAANQVSNACLIEGRRLPAGTRA